MSKLDNISVIDANFLTDKEIEMICSITVISRSDGKYAVFEMNNGMKTHIGLFPINSLQKGDTISSERVVFIKVHKKDQNYQDYYVWQFGDEFPIELLPKDTNSSRILTGCLNREDYFKELEDKKREKQVREEKRKAKERIRILLDKPSREEIVLLTIVCLLFVSITFYFGMIEKTETFVWIFLGILFTLFLVPMIKLCKLKWEELNVYSIGICVVLSITLSIFSYRGIDKLVNGDVYVEHARSSPKSSSSNHGTIGFDPFPDKNVDVYVTRYGNCYHSTRNCYEITKSKHISKISKKKARKRHYTPCSVCYGTY